jgi:hypothetical protein
MVREDVTSELGCYMMHAYAEYGGAPYTTSLYPPLETTKSPYFHASQILTGRLGCILRFGVTRAEGGVTPGVA